MQIGNFYIRIIGNSKRPFRTHNGYVYLNHKDVYKVLLGNRDSNPADVDLVIDGKDVGSFRVDGCSEIVIERPVNDTGLFTFYKKGSVSFFRSGLNKVSRMNLGLISATFKPGKCKPVSYITMDSAQPLRRWEKSFNNIYGDNLQIGSSEILCSAGGTGLSGNSNQQFFDVQPLDYDNNKSVRINLRLVLDGSSKRARELLPVRENKVPAPVY